MIWSFFTSLVEIAVLNACGGGRFQKFEEVTLKWLVTTRFLSRNGCHKRLNWSSG